MNLLGRTRLFAAVVGAATLLLTLALLQANDEVKVAERADRQLGALLQGVVKLRTVAFEFSLNGESRPRLQAEAQFKHLYGWIDDPQMTRAIVEMSGEAAHLHGEIRNNLQSVEGVFRQLPAAGSDRSLLVERDRRSRSLLLLESEALASRVLVLRQLAENAVDDMQRRVAWINAAFVILLAGVIVLALVLLEHTILRPLAALRQAAVAIGQGDLSLRLKSARSDELGELSRAFDAMLDHLDAARKELEAFSYSISHDLRAPLRAIDGFSRKLANRQGQQIDDEGRRLLQVVRDNAQRMGTLIDDLLSFSRMGRREMSRTAVDMQAVAASVIDELRAGDAAGRQIDIDLGAMPAVRGDAAMLRQVWGNLIGNAFKFTQRQASARIEIGGRNEPGETVYWVRDNGAGFDMQYAEKLFGVFQRLHRQDEFEGTGVGLAIAQRVVQRHGGRIWGEGRPGGGATFWFALPATAGPERPVVASKGGTTS